MPSLPGIYTIIYEIVMYFIVTTFTFDVKFMKVQNNQERCVASNASSSVHYWLKLIPWADMQLHSEIHRIYPVPLSRIVWKQAQTKVCVHVPWWPNKMKLYTQWRNCLKMWEFVDFGSDSSKWNKQMCYG